MSDNTSTSHVNIFHVKRDKDRGIIIHSIQQKGSSVIYY